MANTLRESIFGFSRKLSAVVVGDVASRWWHSTALESGPLLLRCLVFSRRVDPCRRSGRRDRRRTSSSTTTTMAVITTFSLRQLQLKWHRKRQVVSCIGSFASAPSLASSSFHPLFRRISRKFMTGYILRYLSLEITTRLLMARFKSSFLLINYFPATSVVSRKFTAPRSIRHLLAHANILSCIIVA